MSGVGPSCGYCQLKPCDHEGLWQNYHEVERELSAAHAVLDAARAVAAQYKITPYTNPRKGIEVRLLDLIGDEASEDDKMITLIDALAALKPHSQEQG